jgi:hypothetical protein
MSRQEYSESETYSSHSQSWSPAETQSESASRAIWVDGYGRSHYVAAASQEQGAADGGAAMQSVAAVDRSRQDPWHGYDSDCDEKK